MSLAYADALTYREDLGGQLGDPEIFEDRASAAAKADLLAAAMLSSTPATSSSPSSSPPSSPSSGRGVVVFTGAGISVSCGIPDFRGPNGVWTRQKKNLGPPPLARGVSFATARPSLTHLALAHLVRAGMVTRVVSQNVDGLHLRSGIAPDRLFELHGNCFVEACRGCGARHERDFETGTVGFKATGRRCERCCLGGSGGGGGVGVGGDGVGVGGDGEVGESGGGGSSSSGRRKKRGSGRLYDTVLDWESPLPAEELAQAELDAARAAVSLCLGTSLQISPANSIPERTVTRKGSLGGGGEKGGELAQGKLVIVNLQKTPKDRFATSVIRARADDVMARVLARVLGPKERLPAWERRDAARVRYEVIRCVKKRRNNQGARKRRKGADDEEDNAAAETGGSGSCWGVVEVAVWVESTHGAERCPLPMVSGVGVAATAAVPRESASGAAAAAAAAAPERDSLLAAAKLRAAREALVAAAEADGEDEGEGGESGGGGGDDCDDCGDDDDSGGRLSSVSLPGPSAPYSARLELEVGDQHQQDQRGVVVVVAVALGLGLGADESRRRSAVDGAAFAVEVDGDSADDPKKKTSPPRQLVQSGSFDVSFVSQVVDYGERVEEARREIEEEERVKSEEKETK